MGFFIAHDFSFIARDSHCLSCCCSSRQLPHTRTALRQRWASIHLSQQSCRILPFAVSSFREALQRWSPGRRGHAETAPSSREAARGGCRNFAVLNKVFESKSIWKLMLNCCHPFNSSTPINYSVIFHFCPLDATPNTTLTVPAFIHAFFSLANLEALQAGSSKEQKPCQKYPLNLSQALTDQSSTNELFRNFLSSWLKRDPPDLKAFQQQQNTLGLTCCGYHIHCCRITVT